MPATIDNALTTVSRAKSYLGITGSAQDTLLSMLIIAVSQFIEDYTRRKYKRSTITNEIHDGNDSPRLYPKYTPIDASQTVSLDRRTGELNQSDEWETVDTEQYFIDPDG